MIKTYSGFVAIIGPTNAGKSTFLNLVIGQKAAIVSHKVQTTRTQIRAVKMVGDKQLVFIDTPGIFKPERRLDRAMVDAAYGSILQADAVLLMVDATHGITQTIKNILKRISDHPNLFVALNKVDAVNKADLLPLAQSLMEMANFKEVFMISALKKTGVDAVLKKLADVMPESPYLFDPETAVDVPEKLYAAEITREKIYKFIHQELPYHIHVMTDQIKDTEEGVVEIDQTIFVPKDSYKKIVVGTRGESLKRIGMAARLELQKEWGQGVRLKLFVKVDPKWEERAEFYEDSGLKFA